MAKPVAEFCIERAVTIEALIDSSGLERGRIEAILLCRWTPSPDERRRIADVFKVTPDEIAWGHATPIQHLYGHGPG